MTFWTDSFEIGAMELKREYVMTAIVSAVIGAGLMLLAVGGSRPAGIEGWSSVNNEIATTLDGKGNPAAEPLAAPAASSAAVTGTVAHREDSAAGNEAAASEAKPAVQSAGVGDDEGIKHGQADQAVSATAGAVGGNADTVPSQPSAEQSQEAGLVSVNSANSTQLQTVPGIGEKKAQAIIDYRNQHGSFNSLSDLKKVKGIGDKVFQKMKPYIRL